MLDELEIANGVLVKYRGSDAVFTIPEQVTAIKKNAFSDCAGLTKVIFPSGLHTIGEFAFNNCNALEEVHVPSLSDWLAINFQGFRSNPLSNGARLFVDGKEATSIIIPEGIDHLGQRVFEGCATLETICFPASVRSIGKLAFSSCASLKNVEFLSEDTSDETSRADGAAYADGKHPLEGKGWGSGKKDASSCEASSARAAFRDAPFTGEHAGLEEIGYGAFRNCAALASFSFPPSLKRICSWAFAQCSALSAILLPEGLAHLERDAFYGCSSVGFVRLPPALDALCDDVFYGCAALESVRIPAGVDAFGCNVFTGCTHIREVWLEGSDIPESFTPPQSMKVLIVPGVVFDPQRQSPSLLLPLAAGFVKRAAAAGASHAALSLECANFVLSHVLDVLNALRFETESVKWLIDAGYIPQGQETAFAARASSFGQPEAAALLLETARKNTSNSNPGFNLEL